MPELCLFNTYSQKELPLPSSNQMHSLKKTDMIVSGFEAQIRWPFSELCSLLSPEYTCYEKKPR